MENQESTSSVTETFKLDPSRVPPSQRLALEELAAISGQLAQVTPRGIQNNRRITLRQFNFFAPYFLDVIRPPTEYIKSREELFNLWIGIVGTDQLDVDVVDDRSGSPTFNRLLFTVPSFYESEVIVRDASKVEGSSYNKLRRLSEAELNFPVEAWTLWGEAVVARADNSFQEIPEDARKEKLEMWAKIYQFYNIDISQTLSYKENKNRQNSPVGGTQISQEFQESLDGFGSFE